MINSDTMGFAFHVGRSVGRYKLESLLGRGAMAEVYKSTHPDLGRDIAVKILHPFHTQVPGFIGRFRLEAQAAASLHHPNIVQVYDFAVTDDGLYYMVMQYINGLSLEEYLSLEKSPLTLSRAFWFLRQIANALQFAHRRGTIHRDVKPANIMLDTRENAYLSDFGLAKIVGVERQTLTGMSPGTPSYMAPEHIAGKSISTSVDIYAMGVILYRMLTNRLPYEGENLMTIITRSLTEPPTPPRDYNPAIPQLIEDIILRAMSKDPQERYPDAISLSRTLADAMAEVGADVPDRPTSGLMGVVPLPGLQLENYKIKREFVRDNVGVSHRYFQRYLAHNVALDNQAVLTVLKIPADEESNFNRRFQERMDALVLLDHPGLFAITRVDKTPANQPYVAYEYIAGDSLEKRLVEWQREEKIIPAVTALRLVRQVAEPLSIAHDVNVIHNDLRPENIIIGEDGTPVLVGLEIPIPPDATVRSDGAKLLDYASPEQLEGELIDVRSNVYSLGILLYELLAGHRPILDWELLDEDNTPQAVSLAAVRSGLAGETYQLVQDCLWPEADARLATVTEFIDRVDQAAAAELVLRERSGRIMTRRQRIITAVPLAAIAIVMLAFGFFRGQANPSEELEPVMTPVTISTALATPTPPTPFEVLVVPPTATLGDETLADFTDEGIDEDITPESSPSLTSSPTDTATATPTPRPSFTPSITPTPECIKPERWVTYVVKRGDVLFNLALDTGVTVDIVKRANCFDSNVLSIGQELWLPTFPATETPTITITPSQTARPPSPRSTATRTPPPIPTPLPNPTSSPSS